ncbi:MAG TPA: SDR family oxidoreductase [Candidatus Nanoarchaeia archaeon]|nr:SDR family oxidoreductase [Candidatus Nanoarchaeia archaeon]
MIFAKNLFKGKIAVITGGGTGIGKSIATQFGKLGAKIAIVHRKKENVDSGVKELSKFSKCIGFQADLRDFTQVEKVFKDIAKEYERIDFLVNNAGGQFLAPIEKISPNGFDAVVKTNLYNTFYCCKAAGEFMKKQKYGKITNMVTIYAVKSAAGMIHSGAARAGVINLTRSLALEWAKYSINVNVVAPGFVNTSGLKYELVNDQKKFEKLKKEVPMGRFADVQEIADAVTFLSSDAASYITAQTLVIDGGCVMANWPKIGDF